MRVGMDAVNAHARQLGAYAVNVLSDMPGVSVHGPDADGERGGVVSFTVDDLHPHDVGTVLDGEGVAIRAGHHCAQPLMRKLGVARNRACKRLPLQHDRRNRLFGRGRGQGAALLRHRLKWHSTTSTAK